jgi:hypothetical protein
MPEQGMRSEDFFCGTFAVRSGPQGAGDHVLRRVKARRPGASQSIVRVLSVDDWVHREGFRCGLTCQKPNVALPMSHAWQNEFLSRP